MEKKKTTILHGNGHIEYKECPYDSFQAEFRKKEREKKLQFIRENPGELAERIHSNMNKINRNCTGKKRVKDICNSTEYNYFGTLNCKKYCRNPKKLLDLAYEYLNAQNIMFVVVLEAFSDGRKGFHIHVLSDKSFNLDVWARRYLGHVASKDLCIVEGDNKDVIKIQKKDMYEDVDTDNYCAPIYTTQEKCAEYIAKKVALTKSRMEKGARLYRSNIRKIPTRKHVEIEDEEGNIYVLFDNLNKKKCNQSNKNIELKDLETTSEMDLLENRWGDYKDLQDISTDRKRSRVVSYKKVEINGFIRRLHNQIQMVINSVNKVKRTNKCVLKVEAYYFSQFNFFNKPFHHNIRGPTIRRDDCIDGLSQRVKIFT